MADYAVISFPDSRPPIPRSSFLILPQDEIARIRKRKRGRNMLNRSGNTTDNLCFRYRFRDVFSRFRCCVYNGTGPLFVHVSRSPFSVLLSLFSFPCSPFLVLRYSFSVPRSPFLVPRSPFPVLRSPYSVTRTPFLVLCSSYSVSHSPLLVLCSSLSVPCSKFTVPCSSFLELCCPFSVPCWSNILLLLWYNSGHFKQRFP